MSNDIRISNHSYTSFKRLKVLFFEFHEKVFSLLDKGLSETGLKRAEKYELGGGSGRGTRAPQRFFKGQRSGPFIFKNYPYYLVKSLSLLPLYSRCILLL